MVIHVVKNASRSVFGELSPVPDGKCFVFQTAYRGIVTPEEGVMQVVSAWVTAQLRHKSGYRQRIGR